MNWILGIDTSSVDLGVGLFKDKTAIASYSRFIRNSHAEHIAQTVGMLLKSNKIDPSEVTRIAVTIGPGSFTGLRIGLGFAKGFSFGNQETRLLPVSSLEVMAYAAQRSDTRIFSAIDARNNEIFQASFQFSKGKLARLTEDSLCRAEEFMEMVKPDDLIITDTMGYAQSTVFNFLKEHHGFYPVENYPVQRGLFCALCGAQALDQPQLWKVHTDILPQYLRLSSAQLKLKDQAL